MRNWLVKIETQNAETHVVLPELKIAMGVINTFMLEGAYVSACESKAAPTHRTSAAAEAFVRLREMQVDLPIMRVAGAGEIHRGIVQ
jgi:hypothetical protein